MLKENNDEMKRFHEEKFQDLSSRLDRLEVQCNKVSELEKNVADLRKELNALRDDNVDLKNKQNNDEQRQRRFCLRISGITIPTHVTNNYLLAKYLYTNIFEQIMKLDKYIYDKNTPWHSIIEVAHELIYKRKKGQKKTIPGKNLIVRFHSREVVMAILHNKNKFLNNLANSSDSADKKLSKIKIYADLTKSNADRRKAFQEDPAVKQAYFTNHLKFVLHGNERVFVSKHISDTPLGIAGKQFYNQAIRKRPADNSSRHTSKRNNDNTRTRGRAVQQNRSSSASGGDGGGDGDSDDENDDERFGSPTGHTSSH